MVMARYKIFMLILGLQAYSPGRSGVCNRRRDFSFLFLSFFSFSVECTPYAL